MPLKIAFHSNQLSITGTEIALYDYALGNEQQLGNKSVIFYDKGNKNNHPQAIEKFRQRFDLVAYDQFSEVDEHLVRHGADLMYMIKSGKRDGKLSRRVPTMVHAVFPTNPSQAHGASYAFISEWLSRRCSADQIPCVPHIVELPEAAGDLRAELGIGPKEKVIGTYGGRLNFDIRSAREAVTEMVASRAGLRFLFMNTEKFVDHPNAIFLPGSTDVDYKVRFINTCDAMLHARRLGESFGLACGEFSVRNKPVITYLHNKHTHHHDVLGDKGFYFSDKTSLMRIIDGLDPGIIRAGQWDQYTARYNREAVMEKFDRHLIRAALANAGHDRPKQNVDRSATFAYYSLKIDMFFNSLFHAN